MFHVSKLQSQNTRKGRLPRATTPSQTILNSTKELVVFKRDGATKSVVRAFCFLRLVLNLRLTSINRDQSLADWYFDTDSEQKRLWSNHGSYFIPETGSLSSRSGEL